MSEKVLHGLWLECLLKSVTQIIALVTRATPLDDLAESADLVFTQINHSVNAVHTSHNEERAVQTVCDNRCWPTCRDRYGKYRFLCINRQGDQHLPDSSNEPPAEEGDTTSIFVGFITHLVMKPATADHPVCTHRPRETNKLESGNDRLLQ